MLLVLSTDIEFHVLRFHSAPKSHFIFHLACCTTLYLLTLIFRKMKWDFGDEGQVEPVNFDDDSEYENEGEEGVENVLDDVDDDASDDVSSDEAGSGEGEGGEGAEDEDEVFKDEK